MRHMIRPATAEDNAGILGLIRSTPQPGRLLLNFEREPEFAWGSQVTCEQPDNWVVESGARGGRIIGTFAIGRRTIYVNGRPRTIRYANDLRLAPEYQGGRMLVRMFRKLAEQMTPDEWMQTVILNDNQASMRTVASGRAGLPTYYPCGDIETSMVFSPPRKRRHNLTIRQATRNDLQDMQHWLDRQGPRRQFFPRYELQGLRDGHAYYRGLQVEDFWLALSGSQLVGLLGVWNQKDFKQTRVLAYPPGLAWSRHLYNLYAGLRGGIRLPPAGGTLNYLTLHTVLVENDSPAIFGALLECVSREYLGRHGALITGFFKGDPLTDALRGCRRQVLHSRQFLASFGADPRGSLDDRLPYVEVARL